METIILAVVIAVVVLGALGGLSALFGKGNA